MPRAALWITGLAALGIKLCLARYTLGTNDVLAFWGYLHVYRVGGAAELYRTIGEFNHPPLVTRWLQAVGWLTRTTDFPPWFWIRLPAILADFGSLLLVARLLGPRAATPAGRAGLLLVAAAPVSLMVSGFHGNTDPVMMFFVLLSAFVLARPGPAWLAGLAMGMATGVKVVPLVFWPAVFVCLRSGRKRIEYFGAAVACILLTSAPVLFQAPVLVARKVLGYASVPGHWGISRFLGLTGSAGLRSLPGSVGRTALLLALLALTVWMNRGPRRPSLYRQLGVLSFAFLTLTPGFGPQYLAWLVPFVAGIGMAPALAFTLASGAFLFVVYTYWCQAVPALEADPNWLGAAFWERGLPWRYADSQKVLFWRGPIIPLEIACWASVAAGFVAHLREAAAERREPEAPGPGPPAIGDPAFRDSRGP